MSPEKCSKKIFKNLPKRRLKIPDALTTNYANNASSPGNPSDKWPAIIGVRSPITGFVLHRTAVWSPNFGQKLAETCVEFTVFGSSENEKFCYSTTKISDSTRDWESRSLDTRKRESKSCVIGNHVLELSFVSQRNIFKRFSNWWKSIIRNWPGFAYRLQFQTLEDRSSKLRRNPDPPDLRTGGRRLSVGEYEDSLLGKMKETHSMHYSDCHVSNFIAQISLHSKVRLLGSAARQHRAL